MGCCILKFTFGCTYPEYKYGSKAALDFIQILVAMCKKLFGKSLKDQTKN